MRAIYDIGPHNGLRVYAVGDTSCVLLHIDVCARDQLRKIGRDAYGADTLRLVIGGEDYDLPARMLAADIDRVLAETDPRG